ncbi:TIGR03086 family metal-binding protein [Glutamicibacter sp.]|uniref:TIGR03086 family metal-binding protein n=1 Tax=Glutamicibacter sp. TaxID=1931995 RepID=UPI003D6BB1D1
MNKDSQPLVDSLEHALWFGGQLVESIAAPQWDAPTPCTDWTVRDLLAHVVGMNLVFAALLSGQRPPSRDADVLGSDPSGAYARSAQLLLDAFSAPGVLGQSFQGPMGTASGLERLQIRLYDLLAHLWDLAQATGQALEDDPALESSAEQALEFASGQLSGAPRAGRFDPPQPISGPAPALDRLAAFLGRPVPWRPAR